MSAELIIMNMHARVQTIGVRQFIHSFFKLLFWQIVIEINVKGYAVQFPIHECFVSDKNMSCFFISVFIQ